MPYLNGHRLWYTLFLQTVIKFSVNTMPMHAVYVLQSSAHACTASMQLHGRGSFLTEQRLISIMYSRDVFELYSTTADCLDSLQTEEPQDWVPGPMDQ